MYQLHNISEKSTGTDISFDFNRILTSVSTMALPSVPSSSLVALVTIMMSLGIPTHQFGLLFSVEWFLLVKFCYKVIKPHSLKEKH